MENLLQLEGILVFNFRGITTGQGMCDLMLEEAKVIKVVESNKKFKLHPQVALMPSSSFLLPPTDLTTRFCYVNFEVGHKPPDFPTDLKVANGLGNLTSHRLPDFLAMSFVYVCTSLGRHMGALQHVEIVASE